MKSSGRALLYVALTLLSVACGKGPVTPTTSSSTTTTTTSTPNCLNLSGEWTISHSDMCGVRTVGQFTVTQTGCQMSFEMPTIGKGTFDVQFRRGTVEKTEACENLELAGGVDNVSSTRVEIVYGEGPSTCCRHGGFLLTR